MEKTKEKAERILLEPYKYLLQLPGKQVRTKLSQAFNHWLKVPEDKLQIIIEVTEMLHNASYSLMILKTVQSSDVVFQLLTASMVSHLSLTLPIMSTSLAWKKS